MKNTAAKDDRITLAHGGGGRAMHQLVENVFFSIFDDPLLRQGNDQACFDVDAGRMVISTDGYVVSPIFFPGGDLGSLAVHGSVNDVAMAGAQPCYLTAGFIIEEGFEMTRLVRIADSMAKAAADAGVRIVAGDTKVVEKGKGDGLFITTTCLGVVPAGVNISGDRARPGDKLIVSGTVGDHGVAVLIKREGLNLSTDIVSDSAPLNGLVQAMLHAGEVRVLRDPTRGGLSGTLNELAQQSACGMLLEESAIPVDPRVVAVCELLGFDPLHIANEGKLIAIVDSADAEAVLAAMRSHPLGRNASLIGEIVPDANRMVRMRTRLGGSRIVDWLSDEQLPRIC